MAFFVQLTEVDNGNSKRNIFDAFKVVAFKVGADGQGSDLIINDGNYSSGGKDVHVKEAPWEILKLTEGRVPFVPLTNINHEEPGFFLSPATALTTSSYFNAAAVTNLTPSNFPIPGKQEPEEGDSTVVQLSSGKRAHVKELPWQVINLVNAANGP